jgi:hypothetical protein
MSRRKDAIVGNSFCGSLKGWDVVVGGNPVFEMYFMKILELLYFVVFCAKILFVKVELFFFIRYQKTHHFLKK